MNLKEELEELYERWLMDMYPDEIHNSDELIEASADGKYYDEFMDAIKANW